VTPAQHSNCAYRGNQQQAHGDLSDRRERILVVLDLALLNSIWREIWLGGNDRAAWQPFTNNSRSRWTRRWGHYLDETRAAPAGNISPAMAALGLGS